MRIGINAEKICDNRTGVGIYAQNLVETMLRENADDNFFLYFFHKNKRYQDLLSYPENKVTIRSAHVKYRQNRKRILWEQLLLPSLARANNVDVFHYIDHAVSLFRLPSKTIITVHDLVFFRLPNMFDGPRRYYKKLVAPSSLKKADRIIAVSNHTKLDIMELLKIPSEKIDVIPYGLDPIFKPISSKNELENFRIKYNLPINFILFVGTFQPRKNLETLIRAYSRINPNNNIPLVLCGSRGWLWRPIFKLIHDMKLEKQILLLPSLPNQSLPLLYNLADLFVYPSWYEGFGLPPLEAMACKTPVIVSDRSSLPEVVGDAGIKVNPNDVDELAFTMEKVLSDSEIQSRMKDAGILQAAKFCWKKTVKETFKTYKKALGKG